VKRVSRIENYRFPTVFLPLVNLPRRGNSPREAACVALGINLEQHMTTINQNQPEPTPFLVWDTFDILLHQAKHLVEEGEAADADAGFRLACEDHDLLAFGWECLLESLTEQLVSMNPDGHWSGEAINFGWQKSSGSAEFQADNGPGFLANILPKTDCTFRIYIENGNTVKIQNFHHDSPTGNEWYTLTPISAGQRQAA
jgi:hypothetical protein